MVAKVLIEEFSLRGKKWCLTLLQSQESDVEHMRASRLDRSRPLVGRPTSIPWWRGIVLLFVGLSFSWRSSG